MFLGFTIVSMSLNIAQGDYKPFQCYYFSLPHACACLVTFNPWVQAWKDYNKSKEQKQLSTIGEANINDRHGVAAGSWMHDQLLVHNNRLFIGSSPLTRLFFLSICDHHHHHHNYCHGYYVLNLFSNEMKCYICLSIAINNPMFWNL